MKIGVIQMNSCSDKVKNVADAELRCIATRYEKLARNFFGMISLACAYIWLA